MVAGVRWAGLSLLETADLILTQPKRITYPVSSSSVGESGLFLREENDQTDSSSKKAKSKITARYNLLYAEEHL